MNLDKLRARKGEIDTAMTNMQQQYQALTGHKAEIEFQISEMEKETKVDEPIVPADDSPVE